MDRQEDVRHCGVPVDAFLSVHYPYDRMSVDPIGGTFMAIAENKSERIEVRTTSNMKALLQRAVGLIRSRGHISKGGYVSNMSDSN